MASRSNALTKTEAVIAATATTKGIRKHLKSITGASQIPSVPQSFDMKIEGQAPAAPSALNDQQAAGQVWAEGIIGLDRQTGVSFGDYLLKLVGQSKDFLEAADGKIARHMRDEREAIDKEGDERVAVVNAQTDLTPQAARKSRREIEDEINRRKASLSVGRLRQVRQILAAMTTSRTDLKLDWASCRTFASFWAMSKRLTKKGRRKFVVLNQSGFESIEEKLPRIVDVDNYDAADKKSQEQIARLEKLVKDAVAQYLKVQELVPTMRPLADLLK